MEWYVFLPCSLHSCISCDTLGLYCEGGPPTDVADLIDQSMPVFMKVPIFARGTHALAQIDQYVRSRHRVQSH